MKWALLSGSLALAGVAVAQSGPPTDAEREARHAQMLAQFDKNKDGKLDDTERQAAKAARKEQRDAKRAEVMARFDTNKDGKLDDTERQAAKAERKVEIFKTLDTNGDNVISLEEFKAAPDQGRGGKGRRGGGGHRGR